MPDPRTIVCTPTADGRPLVPSTPRKCSKCNQSVWLSANAGTFDDSEIMCLPCALPLMRELRDGDTISAAPWVEKDMLELMLDDE